MPLPHHPSPPRQDEATAVQYWKVLLCDEEGSWTAGEIETRERGVEAKPFNPILHTKFRNLRVRWEALETALRAAVDAGGDMDAYRRRWDAGDWWWLSTANATVPAGPDLRQTCGSARAAGLI